MLTPEEKTQIIEFCKKEFKEFDDNYPTFFLNLDKNAEISYVDIKEGLEYPNNAENLDKAFKKMMKYYLKTQDLEIGFFIYLCRDNDLLSFDRVTEEEEDDAKDSFTDTLTLSTGKTILLAID